MSHAILQNHDHIQGMFENPGILFQKKIKPMIPAIMALPLFRSKNSPISMFHSKTWTRSQPNDPPLLFSLCNAASADACTSGSAV